MIFGMVILKNQRKLHIGGIEKKEGWEIFNIAPSKDVEHIGNANDLSKFDNNTFAEIYVSHVLEHFDYKVESHAALVEWHRVLEPKGKIYISVPDLDVLSRLLLEKKDLTISEQFEVMRIMYGGHVDEYDYHLMGFTKEFLSQYMKDAGFENIKKVDNFGLFKDTSTLTFKDVPISLNITATKLSK